MSNLAVKEVEFNGDVLLAAQDSSNKKVYVAVRWISEGIGLTVDQTKRQVKNIQKDLVLSKGVSNLTLPTKGGKQKTLCIELDYLPLWLAKISITPKMKEDKPELVEKLVDYQLKAKDVLANAFVHGVTQIVPKNYKEALQALLESVEENEKLHEENLIMQPKAEYYDDTADSINVTDMIITAKNIGIGEKKLFEFLRCTKVLFKKGDNNYPYQIYQDKGYFEVKQVVKVDKYNRKRTYHPTRVTGEGKIFINKLVNSYGGAKVIDKLKMEDIKGYVENYNK